MALEAPKTTPSPQRYGKRPVWQWIVLYAIIGGLIYGLIYYFVLAKHGGYTSATQQSSRSTSQDTSSPNVSIYTIKTDSSNKTYLADAHDMALYVYDGDASGNGTSNCTGTCASNWPPYTSASGESNLPTNITVILRSDGSRQFAWKGKPLYYFAGDMRTDQTSGDGVNGFHLAR